MLWHEYSSAWVSQSLNVGIINLHDGELSLADGLGRWRISGRNLLLERKPNHLPWFHCQGRRMSHRSKAHSWTQSGRLC